MSDRLLSDFHLIRASPGPGFPLSQRGGIRSFDRIAWGTGGVNKAVEPFAVADQAVLLPGYALEGGGVSRQRVSTRAQYGKIFLQLEHASLLGRFFFFEPADFEV